jgi:hypothetical protein
LSQRLVRIVLRRYMLHDLRELSLISPEYLR